MTTQNSRPITLAILTLIAFAGSIGPVRAQYCHDIGFASCPSGETQFCSPTPINPTDSAQAELACDICYGTSCFLETADCAGPGWGPRPAGFYICGQAYFGYTAGCSGDEGRVWPICNSYTS